eukprot:1157717-Pelagomonas_calceolata.AAC.5
MSPPDHFSSTKRAHLAVLRRHAPESLNQILHIHLGAPKQKGAQTSWLLPTKYSFQLAKSALGLFPSSRKLTGTRYKQPAQTMQH